MSYNPRTREYILTKDRKYPYSLITDLEGEAEPLGVTMVLDLGEVINRMEKEFICIGSGEILKGIKTFKLEEIRGYIVRRDDLKTVRSIFNKWIKPKSTLETEKEVTLKGLLETKDKTSPLIHKEVSDTIISILLEEGEVQVRFIEKNLQFIKGFDLAEIDEHRGIEIYIHGLAILTESRKWEIQGRALLTVKEVIEQ